MAKIDYAALKKGGFMRQKQKGYFSLRIKMERKLQDIQAYSEKMNLQAG